MRPGTLIAERYEVLRLAGQGGMGLVYQARDRASDGLVALKVIRSDDADLARRLVLEARALAELRHPGIVTYTSHGVTAGGEPFLVVEWLDGEDLGARLRRGALTVDETVRLVREAAEALGAAHRRGIVHCDVKPGNLFLADPRGGATLTDAGGDRPRLKVLDFGIARAVRAYQAVTGRVAGTPGYLAPEQARGTGDVDARADVFALGCVIFSCLTGSPPFVGEDAGRHAIFEDAPRLRSRRGDVPLALDDLCAALLARDRTARPADGAEVAAALDLGGGRRAAPVGTGEQAVVSVIMIAAGVALPARAAEVAAVHGAALRPLDDGGRVVVFQAAGYSGDLAVRAARCALALHALVPAAGMALCTARGVVGGGAAPTGEVVARARSLLGGPGAGVRVDDVTGALLETRFEVSGGALGAERARARPGRRTPLVGRDRELATLRALCDEAVEEHHARVALVVGAPGSGKSRLRLELLEALAQSGVAREVWMGQGDPMRSGSPLAVLADALRAPLGLTTVEEPAVRRERIRARVAGRVPAADVARVSELLGEICGTPFPDTDSVLLRAARRDPLIMGDQLRRAFEEWLGGELAVQPVVLVLDDLHWGDLPSLKLVDGALRVLADRPLVVLGLARPEALELYGGMWAERGLEQIHLRELPRSGCARLVRGVLGDDVAPELVERLARRSQGNPFYLEELVRAVAEHGVDAELPETVLAMIDARLGRLPPELRKLLRAASVYGETFWEDGVAQLVGEPTASIRPLLGELVEREWIVSHRDGRLAEQAEHTFRHSLLRDAAYATLPEADRARAHALAARWLRAAGEPDPAALAEHHGRAGETAQAIVGWTEAARRALDGNDFAAAITRAERAVTLGAAGETLGLARLVQSEAHDWRAEHAAAAPRAEEALTLLGEGSDAWASAAHHAAWSLRVLGRSDALEALAATLSRVFATRQSGPLTISLCATAIKLFEAGRYARAEALLAEVEAAGESGEDPLVAAWMANAREYRAMMANDHEEMLRSLRVSLAHWEAAGDRRNANLARINMAVALLELGDFGEAERALRAAITVGLALGLAPLVDGCRQNLGWALALQRRFEEARVEERAAAEAYRTRGDGRYEGISHLYLARIEQWAGDAEAADRACQAAFALLRDVPSWRAYTLAVQASLIGGAAGLDAATAAMDEAVALGAIEEGDAFVRLVWAEAALAAGRTAEATEAAARARDRLLGRAARIHDEALRRSFLEAVPDNARTLALAARLSVPE